MPAPLIFRRLVLAVGHGDASTETMREVAELARLLGLDLHCVLVEDEALFTLTALPFARELRLPNHEWRPIETTRLADEYAGMARELRRTLAQLGVAHALEVLRGDPAASIGTLCQASDIIVLADAGTGRRPRLLPVDRLQEAARRSAASVLLLPARPPTRATPVAAMLADSADRSLEVAARIAASTGAALLVVLAGAAAGAAETVRATAASLGVPARLLEIREAPGRDLAGLLHALGRTHERLIVLDHAAWPMAGDGIASRLAAARGVPVLVIEAPRDGDAAAPPASDAGAGATSR